MSISYPNKEVYTMEDLLAILRLLRSPEGCPWDREQTHKSIRSEFLEETHEAIEAIDNDDPAGLQEELGDVLLQVVFHACMEEEHGGFTFSDVTDGICRKLLVRHPHVFGDVVAKDAGQVLQNWDAIKRATKGGKTQTDLLRAVPRSLPALMRATKVQNRAARAGFDWPEVSGAMGALHSEVDELEEAMAQEKPAAVEEELGDLLFSAVNVSRFLKADAEQALTGATEKFIRRFAVVEQLAQERQLDMTAASIEQLDELWREAKAQEKSC